jgi:Asp-tRNA(Asn)/Glu-tRNA(Gln) amidotransferase C subunit
MRAGYRPADPGRIALATVTPDEVRALAAAAGLELAEERVEPVRAMLELILAETAELDALPLHGVEPLLDV